MEGRKGGLQVALPCLVLILCLAGSALGGNGYEKYDPIKCKKAYDWVKGGDKCAAGLSEVSTEKHANGIIRQCCDRKHPEWKLKIEQQKACRTTSCQAKSKKDLCSTLGEKIITADGKNEKLSYEELMREPCSDGRGVVGMCCMKDSPEGRLLTTMGAEPFEFPHQAKLKLDGACGGTIYNHKYIITASHCIIDDKTHDVPKDISKWKVILGSNLGEINTKDFVYFVKRAIVHEDYSKYGKNFNKSDTRTFNDIALLELKRNITFGPNVKALRIAPEGFVPENYADRAAMVGWGKSDLLVGSQFLMKANFLLRTDKCFKKGGIYYGSGFADLADQLLCVGGIMDGKWSYIGGQGSSGGPAICRGPDGKAVLCGVTSFGAPNELCAKHQNAKYCYPSVYAEVSYFRDWIEKNAEGKQEEQLNDVDFYDPYLYGRPAPPKMAKHQVHITSDDGPACGGTLLKKDVVLTAAHCVMSEDGEGRTGIQVQTGMTDLKKQGKGKMFGVKGATFMEGYKLAFQKEQLNSPLRMNMREDFYKNDLALLQLDGEAKIKESELPKLPGFSDPDPKTGVELSFPIEEYKKFGTGMQARDFRFLKTKDCKSRMERLAALGIKAKVDGSLLCGVETYTGGSTCDRELGGGLICKGEDGKDTLCGVQVFRLCETSIPNGFVDMRKVAETWVEPAMETFSR